MKARWDLTDEHLEEIAGWIVEQLTTGEQTITKEEAEAAIKAFGEANGFQPLSEEEWSELGAMFEMADTNGDDAIDLNEFKAALGI